MAGIAGGEEESEEERGEEFHKGCLVVKDNEIEIVEIVEGVKGVLYGGKTSGVENCDCDCDLVIGLARLAGFARVLDGGKISSI